MPTFRHGRNTSLLFNQYDLSTYFKDASVSQTADAPETTAFQSSVKTYVIGMIDGKVSLGGMFSGDANGVDETLQSVFGVEDPMVFTYAPEGLNVGRRVWGMAAHETSYQVSGSVSDIVAVSAELQGTGGAKSGWSLADPATPITAAGNGTVVDTGASSTYGGWAMLHVLANTSTGAATFSIAHATSGGGSYSTLGTFNAVTAGTTTAQRLVIPAQTINRYVRVVAAGSIDNSIAVHVNLVRLYAA